MVNRAGSSGGPERPMETKVNGARTPLLRIRAAPTRRSAQDTTITIAGVGAVHCRATARVLAGRASALGSVAVSALLLVALLSVTPAGPVGATPTTLPGPAPNQSQINSTQSQVAQIESTLAQQEQQTAVLDDRYNTAMANLQSAQSTLQSIGNNLAHTRSAVQTDKRLVENDAVTAYVYGTAQSGVTSYFDTSATLSQARTQYTDEIVGDVTRDEQALQRSEAQLQAQQAQQQAVEAQAQQEAAQAKSLAAANAQQAAETKATLGQAQGQLAQEVAQAAVQEAQQEAAAAARATTTSQRQVATAAAAAAATVAGTVGGSQSGAAATAAANQAASPPGPVGGSASGSGAGLAAVHAAVSQLGVPYVWGSEEPGVGFDCSGLVQWAWAQAGVSIPRTTETEWPALTHVSLDALQPGDLLFYDNLDGDNLIDHVVMYAGSGPYGTSTVIQAPFTGATVSYSPIFTAGLIGAARP